MKRSGVATAQTGFKYLDFIKNIIIKRFDINNEYKYDVFRKKD